MEKRIFIAVIISIAFLFAWGTVLPRLFPGLVRDAASKRAATPTTAAPKGAAIPAASPREEPAPATTPSTPSTPVRVAAVAAERPIETVVDNPRYTARFRNRGAQLVSFQLKEYREEDGTLIDLVKRRDASRTDFPFAIESGDARLNAWANSGLYVLRDNAVNGRRTLQYRLLAADGTEIVKTFTFSEDYVFDANVAVRNRREPFRVIIGPGIRTVAHQGKDTQFLQTGNGVLLIDDSLEVVQREKGKGLQVFEERPAFVGIEDNYFLTALKLREAGSALIRTIEVPVPGDAKAKRKELYAGLNSSGGEVSAQAFFGPKQAEVLERHGLEKTLKFGMFGVIARVLLTALIWLFGIVKNWGWAIVLLTVVIKIILYPLQHKSIVSMKKMQQVQPKVNAIKDRYKKAKTDPEQRQRMNQEMMKLYQQEGINPMSGCLPILLQLPILWAFYNLLSNAIELRGADFMLWINDLSLKDPYYITPILMTATMFIQQWMTPTTADPAQKRIFMMMPLIFGFIFKDFPSGLVLYWLAQNVLTIIQQMIMNRYWKDHPVAAVPVKER